MSSNSVLLISQNLNIVEKFISAFASFPDLINLDHTLMLEEGITSLKTSTHNLVVIDVTEQTIEYKEIVTSIREYSQNPSIHVVAICKLQKQLHCFQIGFNDCITFPIDNLEFEIKFRNISLIAFSLTHQNSNLVEKPQSQIANDLFETIKELIGIRIPTFDIILSTIESISTWIAEEFEDFTKEEIEILRSASVLWAIGKLVLPDSALRLPSTKNGHLNEQFMTQVPIISVEFLKNKPNFSNVIPIVDALFENFDGTGFPKGLQGWQIPLSARLLRIIIDFKEFIFCQQMETLQAFEEIKKLSGKVYDQRFVVLLEQYITEKLVPSDEHTVVNLYELKEGMMLMKDLITNSGIKLVPKGSKLTTSAIEKIQKISSSDPILGRIYIAVSNEN
jgi:response regulator RpfG family c-di-GMP phosphodiesterase